MAITPPSLCCRRPLCCDLNIGSVGGGGGLLALAVLQACSDEIVQPDSTPDSEPEFSIETSSGVSVSRSQMDEQLTRLARSLAVALGEDPALRSRIRDAIAASPYAEGKLEFSALVDDESFGLSSAMDAEPGRTAAALDSIIDLELYLPVPEHRSWRGDDRLLVASLLSDNFGSPSAFDLTGVEVPVGDQPPTTPTLALVPAETDFSRAPTASRNALSEPARMSGGGGIYMTSSYLTDTHEHWLNGSPEIAVHVPVYDQAGDSAVWSSCAGDGLPSASDHYFDQNDNSWSGNVMIASQSVVEDEQYEVHVWEDDWDRCDGVNHLVPNQENEFLDQVFAYGKAAWEIEETYSGSDDWIDKLIDALEVIYELLPEVTNDDFVGVAKALSANCYDAPDGSVKYTLFDEDGNYKGWVRLVNDFAEREMCPLAVEILGPSEAETYSYCNWSQTISNGVPPFTYAWDGLVSGSGTTASATVTTSGWVELTVTDGTSRQASDYLYVNVSPSGPPCLL